ncbi:NYN domain-containing protein [Candidatus Parcubacteria bacterium]|nr:NYN domain-containing protein [Patescibacteria group bacterium]MBU4381103.1 NYN domain-containing protein [Patescibacteria group bacterium]MCG2689174.1 NYN domain-containing protein [Candidatus Parcubacteria bacterium]
MLTNQMHPDQKVGVFVDVSNMYYSAKNLHNSKVDFGQVLQMVLGKRKLIRAFAYVIRANIEQEKTFFEALEKRGFEVRIKDLQVFLGGEKKGDWDVGLCMDAVRLIPKIDALVLISGDGDYTDLLDYARSQGVRCEVASFGRNTSGKLIERADSFFDLDYFAKNILLA